MVNVRAVRDADRAGTAADLNADGVVKVALGKKKIVLLRPQ